MGPKALQRLTNLYRASLAIQWVPEAWRRSKVVFIPKPGKDDYTKVKSYRPISLSSFLMKAMERVILWEMEATALIDTPLNPNQHGFRHNSSCDSAVSGLVDLIESAILRKQYAIGVFLDIQGAFDNLDLDKAVQGMEKHSFPTPVVQWYAHYLRGRTVEADVKGVKATRRLTRGTPQGGVLSPMVWNLAFDSLLDLFNEGPVKAKGFADDAALVVLGLDPDTLISLAQAAVDKATAWGEENGLKFAPAKTVVIFFNRKKKIELQNQITINNIPVPYSQSARYLGIEIDEKLDFAPHIWSKIKKAKALLFRIKGSIGKYWGPIPHLMKLMYTMMIRPVVTYGAIVWAKHAGRKYIQAGLAKLQRLIMLCTAPMAKSTPTLGLEVIGGLIPLDLLAKGEAIKTAVRITGRNRSTWDGIGTTASTSRGHLRWIQSEAEEMGLGNVILDTGSKTRSWDKTYQVDESTFEHGIPEVEPGLTCYTDGSKIKTKTGWGYRISRGNDILEETSKHLDDQATVFQAEVGAIHAAAESALEIDGNITFYSDSQAALKALNGFVGRSKTVEACQKALNRLGRVKEVNLRWVKAHVGHPENEAADGLAKRGALSNPDPALPQTPHLLSKATFVRKIRDALVREWSGRWVNEPTCRQTKMWFGKPNLARSERLLKSNRSTYGRLIQFITGHNYLGYHMRNVHPGEDNRCRLCAEVVETAEHISSECPVTRQARSDLWVTPDGSPGIPRRWKTKSLEDFLANETISALLDPRDPVENGPVIGQRSP